MALFFAHEAGKSEEVYYQNVIGETKVDCTLYENQHYFCGQNFSSHFYFFTQRLLQQACFSRWSTMVVHNSLNTLRGIYGDYFVTVLPQNSLKNYWFDCAGMYTKRRQKLAFFYG